MAKQYAKAKHYGQVNGWLSSKDCDMRMNRAQRQAFNKLTYGEVGKGEMKSYKNGTRKNVHFFGDGRVFEVKPIADGTGDWLAEKCTS